MKLFGTSGIRRIADKGLVELAMKVGMAVGKVYDKVVVGCDTRTSSEAVKYAFTSGLLIVGGECYDIGIVPTPTVALSAGEFKAGTMITASHNPPEYNGIKLFNPDGSAFDAEQQKQIEDMISSDSLSSISWDAIKSNHIRNGAINRHIDHILKCFPDELKLKVVLDCGCGAASVITPYLLEKLGCELINLNCNPGGVFPRPSEPTETNLADLIQKTRETGADLGIAHDGDGDRMMAVDNRGRFIPGDKLLVLFARAAGARGVVTTVDASMVIDEMDFEVIRTKVGDTYVSEELKKTGDFGGEPSGSWVFPKNSLCPDGIYAAAQLIAIACRQKLSELVDDIPSYPIMRSSVTSKGLATSDLERCLLMLEPLSVDHIDGIKLNFEDGWLLVRPSGTEPRIRLTAEAKTEARVQQLCDIGFSIVKGCLEEEERN